MRKKYPKKDLRCNRCESRVYKCDLKPNKNHYKYTCPYCFEDLFSFEVHESREELPTFERFCKEHKVVFHIVIDGEKTFGKYLRVLGKKETNGHDAKFVKEELYAMGYIK